MIKIFTELKVLSQNISERFPVTNVTLEIWLYIIVSASSSTYMYKLSSLTNDIKVATYI